MKIWWHRNSKSFGFELAFVLIGSAVVALLILGFREAARAISTPEPPAVVCSAEARIAYQLAINAGANQRTVDTDKLEAIAAEASIDAYRACRARIGYQRAR